MKNWARLRGKGVKIGERNIHNLSYTDDTIFLAESGNDLKQLLMKVEEESAKAGLHLSQTQKSWLKNYTEEIYHFDNEDIKLVKDFAHLGSVMNSDGDCSQEIKRRLRLRRAAKADFGKIKSKDVSLETQADPPHPHIPNYSVQITKLDSGEGW